MLALGAARAQQVKPSNYDIQTVIGQGSRGDGGPAASAVIDTPIGLAQDSDGNIYISEAATGVIRRVRAADGVIERFAGAGPSADDAPRMPALQTNIYTPAALLMARDGSGLLFVDTRNCKIRMVSKDGFLSDIAGTGRCNGAGGGGFGGSGSGRDRAALETDLGAIGAMAYDKQGRLLFTETSSHVLRVLDTDGYVKTLAGAGTAGSTGDGGDPTAALLNYPVGIAVDNAGVIYIGDGSNCKVRRITVDNIIETAFGSTACAASTATYTGGPRTALDRVGSLAFDSVSNILYIGLPRAYRVLKYDFNNVRMSPFLGNGRIGLNQTEVPTALNLNENSAILPAPDGSSVLVAANDSFHVYQVKDGKVSTFAGVWPQPDQYPAASQTQLLSPQGVSLLDDNTLLLTDSAAGRLLQYTAPDRIDALAGLAYPAGYERGLTGPALSATLLEPARAIKGPDGNIYFSERARIRAINLDGVVRTVVDNLDHPVGLAFDGNGSLWYAESGQHRIMRLDQGTKTPVIVGGTAGKIGFAGDGGAATSALLANPGDVLFDRKGNLLIVDQGNNRIRMLSVSDGKITTIAGNGLTFNYSDISGMAATDVGFGTIGGLAMDANGNLYLSEQTRVDMITTDGKVQILTGFLSEDDSGARTFLDGPLNGVGGLAVDSTGKIYMAVRQDGVVLTMTLKAQPPATDAPSPVQ